MLRTFEAQNGFKIRTPRLRKKLDVLIKKRSVMRDMTRLQGFD